MLQQDYLASLVGALKSVSAGRFASLREQTRGGKPGNAVVIIFESVSTSCPSGELLKAAKRFSAAHKDVPLIVLLAAGYTPADVENLKANLRADFSGKGRPCAVGEVVAARGVYGEGRVNGSVVLVTRGDVVPMSDLAEVEQALSRFYTGT